ncbi:hypothetical protein STAFG_0587 [Streptomyces afghaniensis 772]|uniref:Uncharacterized protein n=1 Tax=Streptomyces afghaniensis 772 TaxID=1283301 RepID=S4N140_9ACTN|nr:hypothetical protein STAFG_0587 [Streptomyces afghaniensis 772]
MVQGAYVVAYGLRECIRPRLASWKRAVLEM